MPQATFGHLRNERSVGIVLFNGSYAPATTRNQLKRDTACSGKQIQGIQSLPINQVIQDVEEILLGKIGRRSGTERRGHIETTTSINSTYDSHKNNEMISNGTSFHWELIK